MKIALHTFAFILPFYVLVSQLNSCTTNSQAPTPSGQNYSQNFKQKKEILHPKITIYHRSNLISEIYFSLNSKELLYIKQPDSGIYKAKYNVQYVLTAPVEKKIIDSASVNLTDTYSNTSKTIIGKLDFAATFSNEYLLEIVITDLNRNIFSKSIFNINKTDLTNRQNFLVLSAEKNTPIFKDYISKNERVRIQYRIDEIKLRCRYYNRKFPLPLPPFSESAISPFEYKADSIFPIQLSKNDLTGNTFGKPGFYHLQADTNSTEGLTLFRFYDDFPYIKKSTQLLEPLRYITSRQEYQLLESNKNIKEAVDSFWVSIGGSRDKARELIKNFYNRVQNANEYFSSYVEGYKTDKGLIYIIYGSPNIMYESPNAENWVYGEEHNINSLTFTFVKVINPFTDNDYRLERSPNYKTSWLNAIEMWRQGRVTSEK